MAKRRKVKRDVCGIMMPISTMKVGEVTYPESYWKSVLAFLCDAIHDAGFEPIVAWENDKSDIIHSKIVQNIQELPVMVGVLVGDNPNVWLECGMRLWSQKPVLFLVSDKAPKVPFDISPVCCLRFPEDCHYEKLKKLRKEIKLHLKQIVEPGRPSILSHFATVQPSDDNPSVSKVEITKFMTDTRKAIDEIRSRLDTDNALLRFPRHDISSLSLSGDVQRFPDGLSYGSGAILARALSKRLETLQVTPTGPTGPT